jgi:glutamyl-tRNA(Gln) amidotransferase subunit E
MPLIETVTYPDFVNPDEVKEGADYIRFLNRSTGKVETGKGSTRADTNVSCRGWKPCGNKRVYPAPNGCLSSPMWKLSGNMPCCTSNPFLKGAKVDKDRWRITAEEVDLRPNEARLPAHHTGQGAGPCKCYAVNLSQFEGILSHYTQPNSDVCPRNHKQAEGDCLS